MGSFSIPVPGFQSIILGKPGPFLRKLVPPTMGRSSQPNRLRISTAQQTQNQHNCPKDMPTEQHDVENPSLRLSSQAILDCRRWAMKTVPWGISAMTRLPRFEKIWASLWKECQRISGHPLPTRRQLRHINGHPNLSFWKRSSWWHCKLFLCWAEFNIPKPFPRLHTSERSFLFLGFVLLFLRTGQSE